MSAFLQILSSAHPVGPNSAKILEKLGFPRSKIDVIPCGIEINEFPLGTEKDPNLLLAIGRLTEKKAPHLTIQAFAIVNKALPKTRLEIIGDGPLRDLCEQKIVQLGLEDTVIIHGSKNHDFVKQRLSLASVFLQHSVTAANGDTESQGISLIEAMASCAPVVTTNHNGFPETVSHGETGFLVEEGDCEQMASQIIRLFTDSELRQRMSEQGRKRVSKYFNSDNLVKNMRELLGFSIR